MALWERDISCRSVTSESINAAEFKRLASLVQDRMIDPATLRRAGLFLASSPEPYGAKVEDLRGPNCSVTFFTSTDDMKKKIAGIALGATPTSFVMVDLTAVADRVRSFLTDPDAPIAMATWLDRTDEG